MKILITATNSDQVVFKVDGEEYQLPWGELVDGLLALGGEQSLGSLQEQLEKKQKFY